MSTVMTSHNEWATRPADERFESLVELRENASGSKLFSRVIESDLKSVGLWVEGDGIHTALGKLAPYAADQLCSRLGVDRKLLPRLTSSTAEAVLRETLDKLPPTPQRLLVRGDSVRSMSGISYERLWDVDVLDEIMPALPEGWHNPLAYAGGEWGAELKPGGLYRGDRSMFVTLVTGGERALQVGPRAALHKGVMISNSEHAGVRSFRFDALLFNEVCSNNIFWGVTAQKTVRARHMGGAALTALRLAREWFEQGAPMLNVSADKVAHAQTVMVAPLPVVHVDEVPTLLTSEEGKEAIAKLVAHDFTKAEVMAAVETMMREETANARSGLLGSRWDWMQGFTGSARRIPNADKRTDLEVRASKLLV